MKRGMVWTAMVRWLRWSVLAVGVVLAVSCSAPGAQDGFLSSGLCSSNTRNALQLNVDAVYRELAGDACALQLTPSVAYAGGSAFSKTPVVLGAGGAFSVAFSFTVDQHVDGGADGIAFILQGDSSTAFGDLGGGIGYIGIEPSVVVEFDTYLNGDAPEHDLDGNHVGINLNGDLHSVVTYTPALDLKSGARHYAWVDYDGVTLEVRIAAEGVRPAAASLWLDVDVVDVLGGNQAFVGFTAATGGYSSRHSIHSAVWSTFK
jgi:hypothetical protein